MDQSEPVPAFQFTQGNVDLYGGEAMIDIHPVDWLHFENTFAYVRGIQKNASDSTRNLPFIPAPKLSSDLRFDITLKKGILKNTYVKVGMDHYFTQNKIFSAYNTETVTPSYTLVNIGLGTDFISDNRILCSVYFIVNNVMDVAYQSHLSRLKYVGENALTGHMGVYNMGRNFSIKLIVPISLMKTKGIDDL